MPIAAYSKPELRSFKPERKSFPSIKRNPIYIVLDSLKSAHNIGTIFRLADALLVEKLFLCGNTILPPNAKIKRSSRGAERWVSWAYCHNVTAIIRDIKSKGVQIVSAELAEKSIPYTNLKPSFPICLVLGREFDGVSPDVLELSDVIVKLPMFGMSNSLNVALTASVLLYKFVEGIEPKPQGSAS
jgi:tRNA G18 (ribose-2'-O)-methylase SpoU